MKYLDPKADLTFKKVFGEHPDLVISLLNALLPLDADNEIRDIEYIPAELVPANPLRKNSIVDVRCKDKQGRQFLVEMQMIWSREFMQRVLFNASKAYVRQLDKNEHYELLQPVYSLNLVNETFEPKMKSYYHYFSMVNVEKTDKVIDGLHLVFVELPKFTAHTYSEKKMQVLWLRYLTEIDEKTRNVSEDLLDVPEIKKAVEVIEESAYTPAQLEGYETFWDIIRTEQMHIDVAEKKGMARGIAKGEAIGMAKGETIGIAKGEAIGIAKGKVEEKRAIAKSLKANGLAADLIASVTGLSVEEIEKLNE